MLNIYCGRESRDREAFVFDRIGKRLAALRQDASAARRVLLVVPAQYTLKAEEAAFFHLKEDGFLDLQILSGNRLRQRILHETGKPDRVAVNALGRSLLLRTQLRRSLPELETFRKVAASADFLSMAGDLIGKLKQNKLAPEDLEAMIRKTDPQSILRGKLRDMHRIYRDYQAALEGKWIDSEDLLPAVSRKVAGSELIRTSEIWYYDFYSFTATEAEFLGELMARAPNLSLVLTEGAPGDPDADLFRPTRRVIDAMQKKARERRVPCALEAIPVEYERKDRPGCLSYLEKQLYAFPGQPASPELGDTSLCLIQAGNPYGEAQTIAVEILRLLREGACAPEEIAVLTNDIPGLGVLLRRMFALHGIPCFLDEKRAVLHNPLIQTISSLLDLSADDRLMSDVLGFLKPGLVRLASGEDRSQYADIEEFENYLLRYHIRGQRFSRPFTYGAGTFGEQGLRRLENTRARLDSLLTPFRETLEAAPTIREKCAALYRFLWEDLRLEEPLQAHALRLEQIGLSDSAQETRQMWNLFAGLLDQIVELVGGDKADTGEFRDILTASFQDLKAGLLPQEPHSVLIGTVGRTRLSRVKALFIAGANDGVLPAEDSGEGILTDRELETLEDLGCPLSKTRQTAREEEQLVIYQAFTRPSEKLFVSWSTADIEGGQIRPSPLIAQLRLLFPELPLTADIRHPSREADLYKAPVPAVLHLTSALQRYLSGEDKELSDTVRQVYDFLLAHSPETAALIRRGLFFSGEAQPLPQATTRELFRYDPGDKLYAFSPSRLEQFAKCPFMHFVSYGLYPMPRESFEITNREIGDVYHECLMRLTRELLLEAESAGLGVTDPASPFMRISREECDRRVMKILESIRQEVFEGLLQAGKTEEYQTERMSAVARTFIWEMIGHIRKGRIRTIYSEAGFGRHRAIPPLRVALGDQTVLVEGKIDRIDLLQTEEGQTCVKIIDYKSGQADFDRDLIRKGLHLQLMVYLESALGLEEEAQPAGIFYCRIEDARTAARTQDLAAGELPEEILQALRAKYQMDGLFVDELSIVESIDGSLSEGEKSTVIPVKRKGPGYDSSRAVSKEDFDVFRREFLQELQQVCRRLTEGSTDIQPRRLGKDKTACTYCDYRSICLFDTDFPQCRYL